MTYTEGGAAAAIDGGLVVADTDSPVLTGATVSITSGFQSGQDVLGFTNQNGISGSYNAGTGVLTLSGNATVANYQTALRSITYANVSESPSTATRTISFLVGDGGSNASSAATRTVEVSAVNDAPTIATTGSPLAYVENAAPVAVDAGLAVTDVDSASLTGATVSISGGFASTEDSLGYTSQSGISGAYNATTGVLTLSGSASPASYQTALRSVTYANSSDAPSTTVRTVTFAVGDGVSPPSTATRQVSVATVNDPPVNIVSGAQTTRFATPLAFSTATGNAIAVSDADAGSGSVQMTLSVTQGTLTVGATAGLSVTGNETGTVLVSGPLTIMNTALQSLVFTPASGFAGTTTMTVTTNDQGASGGAAQQDQDTVTIEVQPAPTACSPRPPATIQTANNGDGRLRVTVSAGTSGPNASNRLHELRFEAGTNAQVDTTGQTIRSGPFTLPLANRPTSMTFYVRRVTTGQATSLPFAVIDDCGSWTTLAGGGANAF
jgi:hypothetical protein